MFNQYIYKRQYDLHKNVEKMKHDYLNGCEKRKGRIYLSEIKEINTKLTQNYRKRVENFVINMLENPL